MESYTVAQLREIAQKSNVERISAKRKSELYEELCQRHCLPRNQEVDIQYDLAKVTWIPVLSPKKESCMREWKQMEELGRGCCGSVYEACKGSDCEYVLKISELGTDNHKLQQFKRDAHFLKELQSTDLVPRIYGTWICGYYGYQVLQRFDGTVEDLIVKVPIGKKTYEGIPKVLVDKMVKILERLSELGIVHGDTKPDNFLVNLIDENDLDKTEVKITDFGYAADYKTFDYTNFRMGFLTAELGCQAPERFTKDINVFSLLVTLKETKVYLLADDGIKEVGVDWMPRGFDNKRYRDLFSELKCKR